MSEDNEKPSVELETRVKTPYFEGNWNRIFSDEELDMLEDEELDMLKRDPAVLFRSPKQVDE